MTAVLPVFVSPTSISLTTAGRTFASSFSPGFINLPRSKLPGYSRSIIATYAYMYLFFKNIIKIMIRSTAYNL